MSLPFPFDIGVRGTQRDKKALVNVIIKFGLMRAGLSERDLSDFRTLKVYMRMFSHFP